MTRPPISARRLLLAAVLAALAGPAAAVEKNPTSKVYVADLQGEAEVNTGERLEPLSEKGVYQAQGAVFETKPGSSNAMVFSNGTGVFFAPETRLEVRRFLQEPFAPNRADLESEPSVSQTLAYLPRGTVGLCTPRMVAGSTMVYQTPLGSLQIREGKVLVETTDGETKVSLVEGDLTLRAGEADAAGELLQPGEQAIIRQRPGQAPEVVIQPIAEEERSEIDEQVAMACMARRTVYFDVGDGEEGAAELVAVPVTPIELPVEVVDENTMSPSFIPGGQG